MVSQAGNRTALVIGGTSGIGRQLAAHLAAQGTSVVISGRDTARAQAVAAELGPGVSGLGLDLAEPATIAGALAHLERVDRLVIAAIDRDANHVRSYDLAAAMRLVTLKLVGYTEVVHALAHRFTEDASIVLFGGLAKERPYDGSTTVTTVNGGIASLVRTLAIEMAPVRVNAIHPGIVGDSPYWRDRSNDAVVARTPLGRLVTMDEVVGATVFLMENGGVNAVNLDIDGGWLVR
jgi:NAD(P)-dependent dehydrogenase (short-subunit alcohol dehydrogenase family)